MKKILSLMIAGVLGTMVLAGCGSSDSTDAPKTTGDATPKTTGDAPKTTGDAAPKTDAPKMGDAPKTDAPKMGDAPKGK